MPRYELIFVLVLGSVPLVGCGGGGADEGGGGEATGGGEADLSAYQGPIASNDVAGGEQLYNDICMACHASMSPLPNLGWSAPAMRRQIREGGDGMPAIGPDQMTDEQVEAVLAFMVTNGGVTADGGAAEPMGDDSMGEEPMDEASMDEGGDDV